MTDWTTAYAASGPKLAAWLAEAGVNRLELTPVEQRAVRRWRSGENARFHSVDELLTRLDMHLSVVPDEVWVARLRGSLEPRFCDWCEGEISSRDGSGRSLGPAKYATRKFCSSECHQESMKRESVPEPDSHREFLLRRAEQLRKSGLSYRSIADLYGLDYDIHLTEGVLRQAVKLQRWPKERSIDMECPGCGKIFQATRTSIKACSSRCLMRIRQGKERAA